MMNTRTSFATQILNLGESIQRIQKLTIQPSCSDLSNIIKYFIQVLQEISNLPDIENHISLYADEKQDGVEIIKSEANFNYRQLYNTLTLLVDVLPLISKFATGLEQLECNLLVLFKCLIPFLDRTTIETMPYLVATLFMSLPQHLHRDILDLLCFHLLQFTIKQQEKKEISGRSSKARISKDGDIFTYDDLEEANTSVVESDDYASVSVTSILMISFHYMIETMHHFQLVECLMKLKSNLLEDLLCVVAYGTTRARFVAVEILFRYWPDICPDQQEKKSKPKRQMWQPSKCQNRKCCSSSAVGNDKAVKLCLDFKISIALSSLPPPMLICSECFGLLGTTSSKFIDLLLPMEGVSYFCQNKSCKSMNKVAIGTCFDIKCANNNSKRPIRYCKTCFYAVHEPCQANNFDSTLQAHICHSSLTLTIMESIESVNNFVEAIISSLKEAAPADSSSKEHYESSLISPMSQFITDIKDINIVSNEKLLISQYGVWLMSKLCKSVDKLTDEMLGRLLGMLFQWFYFTACLPDDQAGSALEKLKGQCIKDWIVGVRRERMKVFVSCLHPHPIDCSRIGGCFELWPDTTHQIKEGFKRLLCLVPYDILTDKVWDEIMPHWMECFRHEVPENELGQFKIPLCKVFDPELSPLGFTTKQMYNFISSRLEDSTNSNQEQTLYWLQIITMLEIPIPIDFLFEMLTTSVKSLSEMRNNELSRLKSANQEMNNAIGSVRSSSSSSSELRSSHSLDSTISTSQDDDVLLPSNEVNVQSGESKSIEVSDRKKVSLEGKQKPRSSFASRLLERASKFKSKYSGARSSSTTSKSSIITQVEAPTTQPKPLVSSDKFSPTNSLNSTLDFGEHKRKPRRDSINSPRFKLKQSLIEAEEFLSSKADDNLICYILILDILLKQLDLQKINKHLGLDGNEAQKTIELLNRIIETPWIGKHTCDDSLNYSSNSPTKTAADSGGTKSASSTNIHSFGHCAQGFEYDDSPETCVFCEIISTFFQLGLILIEYFSPLEEVSICEVSEDVANKEFAGKPDYSRVGLDHLGPGQDSDLHSLHAGSASTLSPIYFGPSLKSEALEALPKELQLTYYLLAQFHHYQTSDIVSQLLQMIKLIGLHSQVLSKAAKYNQEFIVWCQHNMLVNKLWSLCQLESSEIAQTCVPLLLHCITLPWGVRLFRDLVERDFNSQDWMSRIEAVERVLAIAYFCDPNTIKESTILQSTMASAFCFVVGCLDDIEAIVAQRALVSLETMKTSSLKLLLWSLEVQFDYIIMDRPMILRIVFQLYNHLKNRRFLTWDFFINRFDTIFLESQVYLQQTGEIPSFMMQDLNNTNTKSEIYQKKIMRAKEALQETHRLRSISNQKSLFEKKFSKEKEVLDDGKESADLKHQYKESLRLQEQMEASSRPQVVSNNSQEPEKSAQLEVAKGIEKLRVQLAMRKTMQHGGSKLSRYQSVALLTTQSMEKKRNSVFIGDLSTRAASSFNLQDKSHQQVSNSLLEDGENALTKIAQENYIFGVVHRVCEGDRDTNHSLTFLLMNFLSEADSWHETSMRTLDKEQLIVLRHLNILMGYSMTRKNFFIPASDLRLLPVFNAFLTSLHKVLDFNYQFGTIILDTCLPVLIYCPAPEGLQYDSLRTPPIYSLWLLNPLMRQSWLLSVMAFLYKYQFGQPHLKDQALMLVWIVINTLESHLNCTLNEATLDRCLMNVRNSSQIQDSSQSEKSSHSGTHESANVILEKDDLSKETTPIVESSLNERLEQAEAETLSRTVTTRFSMSRDSSKPAQTPNLGLLKKNRRSFSAVLKPSISEIKQLTRDCSFSQTSSRTMSSFITGRGKAKGKEKTVVKVKVKGKVKGKTKGNASKGIPEQVYMMQPSFTSGALLNEQLAQINRHSMVQEFSDKDLSMCLVILETFIHHEPSLAAQMLPNILRLVARYSSVSLSLWQTGSNVHLVGGSMFVARQFIRVALHDLMENNIFHQIFTSNFTGYEFYMSMATALADFSELNQLSPLIKLFEDLNREKSLLQVESLMTILENVATYLDCLIAEPSKSSQTTWTKFINNWENFLRKLILSLPRYTCGPSFTGNTSSGSKIYSLAHSNSDLSAKCLSNASTTASCQFLTSRADGPNKENINLSSANAIPSLCSLIMCPIMRIILSTSKLPHLASSKTIVDPYSKIISYAVLNSEFKYEHLLEINHNCCRLYNAEGREKYCYLIQRTIAFEFIQVLKFKFFILEENLLMLLLFILQDVGGSLAPKLVRECLKIDQAILIQSDSYVTNINECLRQYIGDLLEFITDIHAISRVNANLIDSKTYSINRDSLGGHVKAAISQYLALEMSLNNGRDNRCVSRYLPWLTNLPSTQQQGTKEFIECVSYIRQLSWIILGSLQHSTLARRNNFARRQSSSLPQSPSAHSSNIICQPIPIEKNANIAEYIHVILEGFADQSKESVLHMSGLFHAFLLCQLWTKYCETICSLLPQNSEQYKFCHSTLDDFWAKITPAILRLVGHSRVMSEMVSTHFLQLIETLIESNSSILIRYLPMWNSVFYSYKKRNKSSSLAIRIQKCIEWQPPFSLDNHDAEQNNKLLVNWLEKVQYKMSHIESQSSQATPFYSA